MPSDAYRIARWTAATRADFFRLHCDEKGAGWCQCVAWWVPTWDGWGERGAAENRALRERLCDEGHYDGYLAFARDDAGPVGWCQVGPRDRLTKLVAQYGCEPDPGAWAVTCFQIDPQHRRRGVARALLQHALADLRARGVTRVEAFPKRGDALEAGELWNGPEALFRSQGFELARQAERGPVLAWTAPAGGSR